MYDLMVKWSTFNMKLLVFKLKVLIDNNNSNLIKDNLTANDTSLLYRINIVQYLVYRYNQNV